MFFLFVPYMGQKKTAKQLKKQDHIFHALKISRVDTAWDTA
jgi:hypothetical protein